MKQLTTMAAFVAALALGATAGMAASGAVSQVTTAGATFGFRLLTALADAAPGKNVFISPFSVDSALSMLMNGAGGATQHHIARTLDLEGIPISDVNDANRALLPSLENPGANVSLSIANAIWADRRYTLNPDFVDRCSRDYYAKAATLDFETPDAAHTINGWVSDKTQGLIDSIVSPEEVAKSSDIITNCVYFKGRWSSMFDKSATHDAAFQPLGSSAITVPMMSQDEDVSYADTGDAQIAALPYGDGRVKMVILLPRAGTDPELLVRDLDSPRWESLTSTMQSTYAHIELPRFGVTYAATLNEPLSRLGMASAFHRDADFAPMGLQNGAVDQVLHKTVLQVDEESTVAAGSTAITMRSLAMRMPPHVVFRVDHPFFVAIQDSQSGAILFSGLIYLPET